MVTMLVYQRIQFDVWSSMNRVKTSSYQVVLFCFQYRDVLFHVFSWKTLEISVFWETKSDDQEHQKHVIHLLMLLFFDSEVVATWRELPCCSNSEQKCRDEKKTCRWSKLASNLMASMGSRFFKLTSFGPLSDLFRAYVTSIWGIKRSLWRSWNMLFGIDKRKKTCFWSCC